MPVKLPTPTQAEIDELRKHFIEKYEQSPPKEPFHPVDLDRVRNQSLWCQRFLEMYELDMQTALDKLWDTCIWRKAYGANDLNESKLDSEYLNEGSVFVHNHDVDGAPLLIFKARMHNKSKKLDELMRILIYWIERTQREKYLTQITVFFDMSDTGLSSLDIDFIKRIIETFKLYYPNALNYILIYELAWILNAAFKVIKGILPPKAIEILKMISKKDIKTYVDKANCLAHWGGSDNYEFRFVPEQPSKTVIVANGETTANDDTADKKVHFANSIKTRDFDKMEAEYRELHTPQENEMLRIDPSDIIEFTRSESKESGFMITSIAKIPVTYKIQTTSPEKFRVRPRCGVLAPNETVNVGILLKVEHSLSEASKDKFLVMGMPAATTDCSPAEIADLWKNKPINSNDIEQHRLVCQYKGSGDAVAGGSDNLGVANSGLSGKTVATNKPSPIDIQEQAVLMQKQLKNTQILQYVTMALIALLSGCVIFLMYQQSSPASGAQPKGAFSCKK